MTAKLRALLVTTAVLAFVAASPTGRAQTSAEDDPGLLERLIQSALGGEGRDVQIRGLRGPLSGEPRISEITVADADGQWLSIRDVALNWSRLALFRGRVEINALTIGEVVVDRAPLPAPAAPLSPEAQEPEAETDAAPFALPELPVALRLDELAVGALRLGEDLIGQAADLSIDGSARLEGGEGAVAVQLVRLDGTPGVFDLNAGFENTSRVLTAELDLREAEGGVIAGLAKIPGAPSLELTVSGADPISDFSAELGLRTAGEDRLAGTVRLIESAASGAQDAPAGQRLEAALSGDITELFLPDYKPFFGDAVTLDLRAARMPDVGILVETLSLRAAALEVSGALDLSEAFAPQRIDLSGVIARPLGLPVVLPLPGPATLLNRATFTVRFDASESDAVALQAEIDALMREDGVLLDRLTVSGDGALVLKESNGIQSASLDIDAALDGLSLTDPKLFDAAGDAAALTARLDWTAGGALNLSDLRLNSGEIGLSGAAEITGLEDDATAISLTADLQSGPLSRFAALTGAALTGEIATALTAQYATTTGAFDVTLDGAGRDLSIGQPQADALLAGPLSLGLTAARGADGISVERLALRNDSLTLDGGGQLASDTGDLQLSAKIADLSVLGAPEVTGPLDLQAALTGQNDLWDATFDLRTQASAIEGTGKIENLLGGSPSVEADARIDSGDLARYAPLAGLPLAGSVALQATGRFDAATGDAALDAEGVARDLAFGQPQADAALAGHTSLEIAGMRSGARIELAHLGLRNAALSLTGQGEIEGSDGTARLSAQMEDIGVLLFEGLTGPVEVTAALDGTGDQWTAEFDVVSNETSLTADAQIAHLFDGPIDATGQAALEARNLTRYAAVAGLPLTGTLSLTAEGGYNAETGDGRVTADGSGRGLSIGIAAADTLLAGPLSLAVDAARRDGDISIDTAQLRTDQLAFAANGKMTEGAGRFDLDLGLANLGALIDGMSGPLDLSAALEGADRSWDIDGALTGPQGMNADISGGAIRPDGSLDLAITGDLPLLIADPFIQPRTILGDALFDLTLQGPPGLEALSGTLTISDARASDPATKLVLEDIDLNVQIAEQRATVDLSSAVATGGTVTVSGPVALTPPYDADITAVLSAVTLLDPALYEVSLAGNAQIQGALLENAAITAAIGIDRAEIKIPSGLGGPGAIPDVVHIAEPPESRETRRRAGVEIDPPESAPGPQRRTAFPLDVQIAAPRQIFVRGRGLDIEMGGGLEIGGTTAAPIPTGAISILRGQLALLGQRLDFDQATIQMQGDLVPILNMVASSTNSGVRAQIAIEGPVTAPELSFTSEPELPEDEVLAQLFFGKPINELTPFEVAQLLGSVNRLTGGGGSGLLNNLQSNIGVDNLGVSTDDDGNTEVTAGKYLTERLYTDVTVGADGTSEIELNYDFNSTFKGRTAFDSEGDSSIGFGFERDY